MSDAVCKDVCRSQSNLKENDLSFRLNGCQPWVHDEASFPFAVASHYS